jgi:hypothetical protein
MEPWLRRMSESTMHLKAKITAELLIAMGAFQLPIAVC